MSDMGLKTFENRLERIDKIHAAGGAFEATGALGRSYFDSVRPKGRKVIPLRALALLLGGVLVFKAAVFAQLGGAVYQERIAALGQGNMAEQAGAWVLTADPITQILGALIASIFN